MKYLIVETHPGFCVALSEDGRYVKCANLRYSVGEKVEDVVELLQFVSGCRFEIIQLNR